MSLYENQRKAFDIIMKKYRDYVALYTFFNNGSTEGVTGFGEFYWRMSYLIKYEDSHAMARSGY